MIVYHFPPLTTSGTYRSLQFARYLPRYGWKPTVLTIRPECLAEPGLLDDEPLRSLPEEVRVLRSIDPEPLRRILGWRDRLLGKAGGNGSTPGADPAVAERRGVTWRDWLSDCFSLPDRQMGWIPVAAWRAGRLLQEGGFDGVYSSAPPASVHLAALLASRGSGVPWIADFRDPWVSNRFLPVRSTSFLDPIDRSLEGKVVRAADRVVANTVELADDFRNRYALPADHFAIISNGYDPEETPAPDDAPEPGGPFTITHAGTLYGRRDPAPLFRAIRLLLDRGALAPDDLRVRLLGTAGPEPRWEHWLADPDLARMIRFEPKVRRDEAFRVLAASDLLLLIQAGTELQVPRKLFDYLSVGRPILAMVTPGATRNIVLREGLGVAVGPEDPEALADRVLEAMRAPRGVFHGKPSRFDFRRLTGELAELLEETRS